MSMTQYARAALANSLFNKTSSFGALASVPTIYIGLSTTTPTTTGGNITEPSGGSYARASTSGSTWGSAVTGDPVTLSNGVAINFAAATADWSSGSNMTYFVMFDALTGGNCLGYGALTEAKPVLNGDTASFAIGALETTLT